MEALKTAYKINWVYGELNVYETMDQTLIGVIPYRVEGRWKSSN